MPRINGAALAAAKAELARAEKRLAKQAAMSPQPSGFAHTGRWRDLAARKVAAMEAGTPDAWRKPRGAAAQSDPTDGPGGGAVPVDAVESDGVTPPDADTPDAGEVAAV